MIIKSLESLEIFSKARFKKMDQFESNSRIAHRLQKLFLKWMELKFKIKYSKSNLKKTNGKLSKKLSCQASKKKKWLLRILLRHFSLSLKRRWTNNLKSLLSCKISTSKRSLTTRNSYFSSKFILILGEIRCPRL